MNRDTIVSKVLNAYTLTECLETEAVLASWIKTHPDDLGMYEIAGQLGIIKMAALERESKHPQDGYTSDLVSSTR